MFAFYPFFHMQISRQKFTITPFLLQYLISRDEMRSANLALISGCHHNKKKRKMCSSAFYHNYLFLCKKSGIFRDLVATLERKSAGGFWMPLNA